MKKNKFGPLFRDKFFGAPYKLGGKSKEEGFDCFSFIYYFHKELGFDMPSGIDGVSAIDYSELWNSDEEAAKDVMWNYINTFTEPVQKEYMIVGDIVVIQCKKNNRDEFYPGIYLGNGLVGASFDDEGIKTLKYELFNIFTARRWKD